MKKTYHKTSVFAIVFVSSICFIYSKCLFKNQLPVAANYSPLPNKYLSQDSPQIIVWQKPGVSPAAFKQWQAHFEGTYMPTQKVECGNCSTPLFLYQGSNIPDYIMGQVAGGTGGSSCGTSRCPPSGGGNDTVLWCTNNAIKLNDSVLDYSKQKEYKTIRALAAGTTSSTATTSPVVAVFDTGVDPNELTNYLYHNTTTSCLGPSANDGWNFPDYTGIIKDNFNIPQGHGGIVADLIVQQVVSHRDNNVRILPVKIHDSNGMSNLFYVLCGIAYAKERGANIINASFGYYAPKKYNEQGHELTDSSALLLKAFINYYLTQNNILLVAAAGNKNDAMESMAALTTTRNLDRVYMYPASLSKDLNNVIAVTTVDDANTAVSPHQNFSKNVVDIGVNADLITGNAFFIQNPRLNSAGGLTYVEGSSFATPVVSGLLASQWSIIQPALSSGKPEIFKVLIQKSLITTNGTPLDTLIMDGKVIKNATH
jgi:hypothetical protein